MKELEKCKDCEWFNPRCPMIIEEVIDVDDGVRKYSTSRDVTTHVPGCEHGDDPCAFEFMENCPLEDEAS